MTQHPITPPRELVMRWETVAFTLSRTQSADCDVRRYHTNFIAARAAQWGADQELEACCLLMDDWGLDGEDLMQCRRPKPPSLKEQALEALEALKQRTTDPNIIEPLRRALEQLDD